MRKMNVFGKKVGQFHLVYIIAFLFAVIFAARWWIIGEQEEQLLMLQEEQLLLDRRLNVLIESENRATIHALSDIQMYLPTKLSENDVIGDMNYLRDVAGFTEPGSFDYQIIFNVGNPLDYVFPTTMEFVEIRLSVVTLDIAQIEDFIGYIDDLYQIYYFDSIEISFNESEIQTNFVIYTFYNAIP